MMFVPKTQAFCRGQKNIRHWCIYQSVRNQIIKYNSIRVLSAASVTQ